MVYRCIGFYLLCRYFTGSDTYRQWIITLRVRDQSKLCQWSAQNLIRTARWCAVRISGPCFITSGKFFAGLSNVF